VLREEHRLRVLENGVLRGIFESKRDKMTKGWRILHNEELHGLYVLPNIIRMVKSWRKIWAGACSTHGGYKRWVQNFGWEA
jgi:hypothetical protein